MATANNNPLDDLFAVTTSSAEMSPVTSKPAKRGRIKTGHFEVRSSYHFYFFNQEVLAAS